MHINSQTIVEIWSEVRMLKLEVCSFGKPKHPYFSADNFEDHVMIYVYVIAVLTFDKIVRTPLYPFYKSVHSLSV